MEKLATQLLNSLSDWAKNNPDTVSNMLTAGGVGALLGGIMPASSDDKTEGASSRVLRRLKNALIGGALGVGGMGLLNYGMNQFKTAIPADEPTTATAMGDAASSGLARLGYGAGALGATGVISGKMRHNARKALVRDLGLTGNSMSNTEKLLKAYATDKSKFLADVEKHLPKDPLGRAVNADPSYIEKKLAQMGVHTPDKPWNFSYGQPKKLWLTGAPKMPYLKSLLKGNARRGAIGLGLAGLAAAAPSIVSSITGD